MLVSLSILLSGPPSPTDVTAVQSGPTSITVTWTPPNPLDGITGYRIYFTGDSSGSETVSGGNTMSHTLTGLTNGQTYTISIVAASSGLSSAPVQVTVGLGMLKHLCVGFSVDKNARAPNNLLTYCMRQQRANKQISLLHPGQLFFLGKKEFS